MARNLEGRATGCCGLRLPSSGDARARKLRFLGSRQGFSFRKESSFFLRLGADALDKGLRHETPFGLCLILPYIILYWVA